MAKIVFLSF